MVLLSVSKQALRCFLNRREPKSKVILHKLVTETRDTAFKRYNVGDTFGVTCGADKTNNQGQLAVKICLV